MAREPIRWDNVGLPQFSNSALAVASGAFGGAADNAGKLVEVLRAKELENQAKKEQDALNIALGRLYADGKATPADLENLPPGVDMAKLTTAFQELRKSNAGLEESRANVRASNASAALSEEELKNAPDAFKTEQALRNAQTGAANASAAASQAQSARTTALAGDEQTARATVERITKGVQGINHLLHGTGEGSLAGEAELKFPEQRNKLLQDAATELGIPVDKLPVEAIKKIDTLGKDQFIKDYINSRISDERFLSELVNKSGLTEDQIKEHSAFGKDLASSQKSLQELRAKAAEEENNLAEKRKKYIANTKSENYENVIYNGTSMDFGEANTISKGDMEAEAARLGIDAKDPRLEQIKRQFPHRQSFRNALLATTESQTGFFGGVDTEGKRKFTDNFNAKLGTLIDQREATLNKAGETPDTIKVGKPEENLSQFIKAEFSGASKSQQKTPEKQDSKITAKDTIKKLTEGFGSIQKEVDQITADLPKSLRTPEVNRQLNNIAEALRGSKTDLTKPIVGQNVGATVSYAETPLTPAEITTRLQAWKGFLPTLQKQIEDAKISKIQKDELQKFFEEFNK